MSLDGAKLICINGEDGSQEDIIPAHGRTLKFGYYMNCDVVLEHPDALGLQCTIDCDAFGRVTIENRCPDQPITLDGKACRKLRPLLHNTEICILEKKYLWQFEGNPQPGGFQTEDVDNFTTPSKQIKKAEQPPMSEPPRRWCTKYQKRLTIHSFGYCIKAGSPLDVEPTTDENKPLNTFQRIIATEPLVSASTKRSSSPIASDLIDLKTPKIKQRTFAERKTPLSCCKLSETVITSYSPRETGVRPEKTFAIVQYPAATPTKSLVLSDVSLGPFQQTASPLTHNHRPSMHLIDLTTPMKRVAPASPSSTLLKSALKKNIPKGKAQPQEQTRSTANISAASMESTVYSVTSTDDSVIELSDEGSFSPSPVLKTPPRPRTPQSLMKRAILSSAKKAAITKRLQQPPKPPPPTPSTPRNPPVANEKRFQSQSTPQRKSIGRFQSPGLSLKASQSVLGKSAKSMVTSTPFRASEATVTSSRRSSILRTPSTSLTGLKSKSRVSLMLTQALSKSPQSTQRRKSVSFMEAMDSPCKSLSKARKSVSFLDRIESEEVEDNQPLNETFTMEEDQGDGKKVEEITTSREYVTFSPEKETCQDESPSKNKHSDKAVCSSFRANVILETEILEESESPKEKALSNTIENSFVAETPAVRKDIKRLSAFKPLAGVSSTKRAKSDADKTLEQSTMQSHLNITFSPEKSEDPSVLQKESVTAEQITAKTQAYKKDPQLNVENQVNKITQSTSENSNLNQSSIPQTPQSTRSRSKLTKSTPKISGSRDILRDIVEDDDFESLDTIFKTPKARNLMILSSPKSISLQKAAPDSVELVHSTEFDLSTNLDDIFKTPQSEFITNRVETETTPADTGNIKLSSSEEAFDLLAGRPINRRSYVRKTPPKKQELSPLKVPKDPDLPNTDIEEWIENVNESIELLDGDQNAEDEISYLTATTQGEFSRDPLMLSSLSGSVSTTTRKKHVRSHTDESVMTIQEDPEEENIENASALKDPLEMTVHTPKRSLSPNISGIDLLDHTSESLFSETLAVSDESSGKECEKTIELLEHDREETVTGMGGDIQISPDKARREMEKAFENFEKERRIVEGKRLVSTPEPKKSFSKDTTRRTMGNQQTLDAFFDLKALKTEREMELVFEKFEEKPSRLIGERLVWTPEEDKPVRKNMRRTMGNEAEMEVLFDVTAAKAEREMELAFENFEEKPIFSQQRVVQTPEPAKASVKDNRRTIGNNLATEVKIDFKAAKAERELELAFENFEEEPTLAKVRVVQTPEAKKASLKDHRRTMGSSLVSDVKLDLMAAKAEREMELAFENFEENPTIPKDRVVKTPQPNKLSLKDHRRTMGSSLTTEVKLDLKAAKAQREMELAFENFEENPTIPKERVVKTPQPNKLSLKDHRRTMGSSLTSEVKLDLKAAKAQREMELAFENFEEEPEFSDERVAKTPEPKKSFLKDHRRTMGSSLVSEVKLDLEAAKAQRELELAFENFEEEPEFSEERVAQTPEPKKMSMKDHRRTMGSSLVSEVKLDLEAAKAQREMELAFENFEEEPEFSEERVAQTPEPKKMSMKDHRRTMGSSLVSEVKLDLEAAKAQREMELAFENFEEEPEFCEERVAQTPEPKKMSMKDHRRTMGSSLVSEVKLDLEAAKAQRELELAFENFEEEPEFSEERVAQTPEPKKMSMKDHRRTMGSSLVSEVKLDLEAAKAQRELELAFENFEEEPEFSEERVAQTPEPKKMSMKNHRRTMGSSLVSEVKLDLEAAKAQRELELAFENFEEEPEFSEERVAQTPEPKKMSMKDHRRTMGSSLVSEVKLDLEAAKAQREIELAFENFEEEPEFCDERVAQTPEPKKMSMKDHRRTMGSSLVSEVKLDLEAAKAQRELELAFENFEEEPEFSEQRVAQTPEPKKMSMKDHRRTMGSSLVSEVKLDLEAAKAQREMELAFENFEEEPEFSEERVAKTPEPKKTSSKDHRRTMGSGLATEVKLDLKAAKAEREIELAFENFEEKPPIPKKRAVQTPEPKKSSLKDHRRTVGTNLIPDVKLDVKAAKAEREMELIFENFKEEAAVEGERLAKTPDIKERKMALRMSLGYHKVLDQSFDLQAIRSEREQERKVEEEMKSKKIATEQPSLSRDIETLSTVTENSNDEANEIVQTESDENLRVTESQNPIADEDILVEQEKVEENRIEKRTVSTGVEKVSPQEHQKELHAKDNDVESTIEGEDATKTEDGLQDELSTPSTEVIQPKSRGERQNTVDQEFKQEKLDELPLISEPTTAGTTQPRNSRRDRNTIDEKKIIQEYEEDADEPNKKNQTERKTRVTPMRSRRRRQNTIDDIDNESDDVEPRKTPDVDTPSEPKMSVTKRTTSENSVDVLFSLQKDVKHHPNEHENVLITEVDTAVPFEADVKAKDEEIEDLNLESNLITTDEVKQQEGDRSLKTKSQTKQSVELSVFPSRKRQNNSTSEGGTQGDLSEEQNLEVDSTGLDSTEDEVKHEPRNRKKRLLKTTTITEFSDKTEAETHHQLDPIVEEERSLGTRSTDEKVVIDANPRAATRPVRRRVVRKEELQLQNIPDEDAPKSSLNLKTEVGDIISSSPIPSSKRIRGRRAQLTVVLAQTTDSSLAESQIALQTTYVEKEDTSAEGIKTWQTLSVKLEPAEEHTTNESKDIQTEPVASETESSAPEESTQEIIQKATEIEAETIDNEEMIVSTPAPLKTHGRRLASKAVPVESPVLAMRRSRKESIQQVSELKAEEVDADEVVLSTPVPSKVRGRKAIVKLEPGESTAEKLTPARRGRRGGNSQAEGVEEMIQSTPVLSQTRGRRAAQKPEPTEASSENLIPARKGRRRKIVDDTEVHTSVDVGEIIPSTVVDSVTTAQTPERIDVALDIPSTESLTKDIAKHSADVHLEKANVEEVIAFLPQNARGRKVTVNVEGTELDTDVQSAKVKVDDAVSATKPLLKSRGCEPKLQELGAESSTPEAVQSTQVLSKTRSRRAALKVEPAKPTAENSTPVRKGRRKGAVKDDNDLQTKAHDVEGAARTTEHILVEQVNNTTEGSIPEDSAEHGIDAHIIELNAVEAIQSTSLPSKTRGRRAPSKVEPAAESSTPVPKRARRGTIDTEIFTEKATSKTRGHLEALKLEPIVPTAESSTPARKRGRRGAVGQDREVHTEEEVDEVVPSKKRGREAVSKPALTESTADILKRSGQSGGVQQDSEIHAEKSAVASSGRLEHPVAIKLESIVATPESSTLVRKRGRRGVVEQDSEIHTEEDDVDKVVPTKKRGRAAVPQRVPTESTVDSSKKSGQSGDVQQDSEIHTEKSAVASPKALEHPVTIKLESIVATAESSTPVRKRGRRGAVQQDPEVHTGEDDVDKVVPTKKRGRAAVPQRLPTESTADSSKKSGQSGDDQQDSEIHTEKSAVASPKALEHPVTIKLESIVAAAESSTPVRKRGRRGAVQQDPEVHTEEEEVDKVVTSKKRGRPAPTQSTANSLTKSGDSGFAQQDSEVHTEEDDIEKAIPSKRRGRPVISKPEPKESENSTKRVQKEENLASDVEDETLSKKRGRIQALKIELADSASESSTPVPKRGRRAAAQKNNPQPEVTEASASVPMGNQANISNVEEILLSAPASSRGGRGRQVNQKVESVVSQRRGRKVINNVSVHQGDDEKSEETTDSTPVKPNPGQKSNNRPTRSRRPSTKETSSTKTPQAVLPEEHIQPDEVTSEKISQKKPIRSRRLLSSASPLHAVSDGEQTQSTNTESEEKFEKKPIRGRRAPLKKYTTVENTSHTEEDQPASATKKKQTRGRKPAVKAETSSEIENIQVEESKTTTTSRGPRGNIKNDIIDARVPSEDEVEQKPTVSEEPNKKPVRGRRGAQAKTENIEEEIVSLKEKQPSPAKTKTTRDRKAAPSKASKDTDDEQSQSEVQKKPPARSRKAQVSAKEEEKPVTKRGIHRNLEVPTDDDTPSKRVRRKPNILLSDEFIH